MKDLIAQGSAWLAQQQRQYTAQHVHYTRGASTSRVPATRGRSEFDVTEANGFVAREETDDFLIHVDDLKLDDEPIRPQANDRIIVGDLDDGEVFQVFAPQGQKAWRWADAFRNQIRIHTKRVGHQPRSGAIPA